MSHCLHRTHLRINAYHAGLTLPHCGNPACTTCPGSAPLHLHPEDPLLRQGYKARPMRPWTVLPSLGVS